MQKVPAVNGGYGALVDYGEAFFSLCGAYLTDNTLVYGGTGDNYNLVDGGGNILSAGGLVAPTVIQCSYNGALPMA